MQILISRRFFLGTGRTGSAEENFERRPFAVIELHKPKTPSSPMNPTGDKCSIRGLALKKKLRQEMLVPKQLPEIQRKSLSRKFFF
ncbi:MAG: hypothetical protein Ct9H90mP8_1530 [Pseudomonadota bacterium]|nr:MAG: hypothetical protein Ct9H90mP8_1530 [Pseudomonadota bacterium]